MPFLCNSQVITDGLVGYWPLDGDANDASGFGNHGTEYGVTLTTDRNDNINSAFSLLNSSQYVTLPSNNFTNPGTSEFSISLWFKSQGVFESDQSAIIITKRLDVGFPNNVIPYAIYLTPDGEVASWTRANSTNNFAIYSTNTYDDNEWHHLAVIRDNTGITMYIDKQMEGFGAIGIGQNLSNSGQVFIGREFNSLIRTLNGSIDDIMMFNRAITPEEIQIIYDDQPIESGASGVWKKSGTTAYYDNGPVAIGSSATGSHKLAVNGSIGAREIKVEAAGWSDFVFDSGYELRSLTEVEKYVRENGHLPEIPNEEDVKVNGVNLGEMNAKLLQKIEELTLYLIEQNKELKAQNEELKMQRQEIETLRSEVSDLKEQ